MRIANRVSMLIGCLALTGCLSEDVVRYDGVTTSAGDAIAANTAMQMIDPWPRGVEDTRLRTPADREQYRRAPVETDTVAATATSDI